jgi:hypothetical protein
MPVDRTERSGSPNFFFIIGGQRCGSTMLRRALSEHPEIRFLEPERPEPKTFLQGDAPVSASQYAQRFGEPIGHVLGEKSTSYLDRPDSAERIHDALPGARIVAIVREPLARAVSHYRFSVENRAETLDMAAAFTPDAEARSYDVKRYSVSPFRYLARGRYADLLQRWVDVFSVSRVHVVVFERLVAEPETLALVHRYLGIDPRTSTNLSVVNRARGPTPELSGERTRDIRRSFVDSNRRLARMFGLDLDVWGE